MKSDARSETSEAIEQARAKARQLASAFAEVFGQPRKRTGAQQSVLEHLSLCAGDEHNAYRFHESRDGISLIAAGIHRDGAKSLLRIIERQLSIASEAEKIPKPTPKIKR